MRRGSILGSWNLNYHQRIRVNTARAGPYSVKLVAKCARELGMEVVYRAKPDCDLYWHRRDYLAQQVPHGAYVSTTPGIKDTFSKSILASLLNRMQTLFPDEYQFYPKSWSYPEECGKLDSYIKQRNKLGESPTFIFKPSHGSLGVDIFLFKDLNSVSYPEPAVIQEYISNPLLLDGLKFDLRLYVLVASFNPMEVYVSNSGLVRFCTIPYKAPTIDNLQNDYMHLTNYAINKNYGDYSLETGKSSLSHTLGLLRQQYNMDNDSFWIGIQEVVAKTLIAVLPRLRIEARSFMLEKQLKAPLNCFQLLGFDLMMDEDYKLHLLEVNSNPSQSVVFEKVISPGVQEILSSDIDLKIKKVVITDCLKIMQQKILKCDEVGGDTSYTPVSLEYPDLMLLEQCVQLFFSITTGMKMELSDFIRFTKSFNLIDSETFSLTNACALFNALSTEDQYLSFEGFVAALQDISYKLYGKNSCKDELQQILKHCSTQLCPYDGSTLTLGNGTSTVLTCPPAELICSRNTPIITLSSTGDIPPSLCHDTCATCSRPLSSAHCLTCAASLTLRGTAPSVCTTDNCGGGEFLNSLGSCAACAAGCRACTGPNIADCLACEDETLYRLTTNQASSSACVTAAECDDAAISTSGDCICNNLREASTSRITSTPRATSTRPIVTSTPGVAPTPRGGGASSIHYHQFLLFLLLVVHSLYL